MGRQQVRLVGEPLVPGTAVDCTLGPALADPAVSPKFCVGGVSLGNAIGAIVDRWRRSWVSPPQP